MGSAVTFPIQTIVFTLVAHFAMMVKDGDMDVSLKGMRRRATSIRVFGDDIIVRNDCYELMVEILTDLGLKVNQGKSFTQGFFREACGVDAFYGVDVTPAYIRTPYAPSNAASLGSVIECSNNFHKKGLWHCAEALLRTVPDHIVKDIIRAHEARWSLTLYTFCSGVSDDGHKVKWDKSLHRYVNLTRQLSAESARVKGGGNSSLLQYFTEDPSQYSLRGGVETPPSELVDYFGRHTPYIDSRHIPGDGLLTSWTSGQVKKPTVKQQRRWVNLYLDKV
jgi:hypothetical protein